MDKLTAIRSFGNPRFCPAKGKSKIYNDSWYLCTFQNTETDQGDGHYLVEGEHVKLLPGNKARQERDSQMCNLNDFAEYHGEVYQVTYTFWPGLTEYGAGMAAAEAIAAKRETEQAAKYAEGCKYIEKQLAMTIAEVEKIYGNCSPWKGAAAWLAEEQVSYDEYKASRLRDKAIIIKVPRSEAFVKSFDQGDATYKVMTTTPKRMGDQYYNLYRDDVLVESGLDGPALRRAIATIGKGKVAATPAPVAKGDISVTYERDWTWITFPGKPADNARDALKGMGARFSGKRCAWYIGQHVEAESILAAIG